MTDREVWITGIGLVSCYGEGAQEHWNALGSDSIAEPTVDAENFKPYYVHPLPEMDWSKQIPRRGDQRQMENWQRLGTYSAGLALEDAGIQGDEELVSTMDLVVAAGGGERDLEVDVSIMREALQRNDREYLLNERLMSDLRPTLFLAQLSNLLAGNISIVHKVTGSSRTYMGEENAGVTAIEDAFKRIRAGQCTHLLVGGAFNAQRPDLILSLELINAAYMGPAAPVQERQKSGGGVVLGSVGAFLVFEEAEHARARGAKAYAKIGGVASDLGSRDKEATEARLDGLLAKLDASPEMAVLSGASGFPEPTLLEFEAIRRRMGADAAIRAFTSLTGDPIEANFPLGMALGALAIHNRGFYAPFEAAELPVSSTPQSILVSSVGYYRGEGFGRVEAI